MADKYLCRKCRGTIGKTQTDCYRAHTKDGKQGSPRCENVGCKIPPDILNQGGESGSPGVPKEGLDFAICPKCGRKVELTSLGYLERHDQTLRGGNNCPNGGVRYINLQKRTETVLLPGDRPATVTPAVTAQDEIDGAKPPLMLTAGAEYPDPSVAVSPYIERLKEGVAGDLPSLAIINRYLESALPADSGVSTETSSPESATTSTHWDEWTEDWDSFFLLSAHLILMDAMGEPEPPTQFDDLLFTSRGGYPSRAKGPVQPMSELAKMLAERIKETFFAYQNRKTTDNRSAQTTLGPSEIGTPCDRRLAMALMNIPAVNPGGDGWAAFVGTCTHVGMAEVYTFADAGTGRYAVEMPVFLGVPSVPRGTTDLLDRRDGNIIDWKVMGANSLRTFKAEGPSDSHRVQAHVYGLGAERGGEEVQNVAIVGLPRAGASLNGMHVWTEKFNRQLAVDALNRVEEISNRIAQMAGQVAAEGTGPAAPMEAAREFETGDDCTFCPFYLKNDKKMVRGCPGSQVSPEG